MKIEDIKSNAVITCKQNNVKFKDFLLYCILDELGQFDYVGVDTDQELVRVRSHLVGDYSTLCDARPPLEENEELAFAIDFVLDMYEYLLSEGDDYV